MPERILDIKDAVYCYGDRKALNGLSLGIDAGEIYALLGPNGAGKTTAMRAIAGRIPLREGSIHLCGVDPRQDPSVRRGLGVVPQDVALYPHLTAFENLEMFGRVCGVSRAEIGAKATEALEAIDLADRAGEVVSCLSGGMKRRLNIAAAALHDPKLIVLDEPTVGVDVEAREHIHTLLCRLRERGVAMLLTTHDMDQAERLGDRVGVIVDGRVAFEGRPNALIRETFGDDRELTVMLNDPPCDKAHAFLTSLDLDASEDKRLWSGRFNGGYAEIARLNDDAAAAGLKVEELRLREPDLRGVYFHAIGREFEA